MICLGYLAGTATHSTSELSWSMATGEKWKAPSRLSTTTCVLLNGCPHFAQLKESGRRGRISVQIPCTWAHLRSAACWGAMSAMLKSLPATSAELSVNYYYCCLHLEWPQIIFYTPKLTWCWHYCTKQSSNSASYWEQTFIFRFRPTCHMACNLYFLILLFFRNEA